MSTPHDDDPESSAAEGTGIDSMLEALALAPRPPLRDFAGLHLPEPLSSALESGLPSAGAHVPVVGDVIDGRYRIDGLLGAGGMGVVFAAAHVGTGRRVALKWLQLGARYRTEGERDSALQRFIREAQAAGRIRHPNVVDVHDAGAAREAPFLVMELLEGETLRARIDRAVLSWEEALALLLPVMDGVEEAHRRGVIHRDLKPDNVFLARTAHGDLCPKVLDFGISRLHAGDLNEPAHPSLTRTGAVIGTPAYMPLEQLRAAGSVDARTDVYALGVVLYEMLSQKRPYVARNAADFAALMTSDLPTALSKHRPDLRGARERAVMKALSREAELRYPSVRAFAQALQTAVERSGRRHLVPLAGSAVALTALGAVLAFFSARGTPPVPTRGKPMIAELAAPSDTAPMRSAASVSEMAPSDRITSAPPLLAQPTSFVPTLERPRPRSPQRVLSPRANSVPSSPTRRSPTTLAPSDFSTRDPSLSPPPAEVAAPKPPPTQLGREQF